MNYHPLLGISIFFITIIISFLLGRNAYKKYKKRGAKTEFNVIKSNNNFRGKPPKGEITSPDAPWLKE